MNSHKVNMKMIAVFYFFTGLLLASSRGTLANLEIKFVEEPKTNQSCYRPGETGTLTTKIEVPVDLSKRLDRYTIGWNGHREGTGIWVIKGSECLNYNNCSATWKATIEYDDRVMFYKMEVRNMKHLDETASLHALVIDCKEDQIVAKSSGTAKFRVSQDCGPVATEKIHSTTTQKIESSSSSSTSSTPSPAASSGQDGFLFHQWNTLTSRMEDIHQIVSLIPSGYIHAGNIPVNIFSVFLVIVAGLHLFFPDVYDLIRERCRKKGRLVLQHFREESTPEENDNHQRREENTCFDTSQ